jgi:GNAT superfamily N-acetyltransferase
MLRDALKRVLPQALREQLHRASHFVYSDVEGVVAERDIATPEEKGPTPPAIQGEIFAVSADSGSGAYLSALQRESGDLSRTKARRYFRNGFRGTAVLRDGHVVGAVWSVTRADSRLAWVHDDLRRLRIKLSDGEAYMFDMYIEPEHRGLALSTALFRAAYCDVRARGVVKVKGYYVGDNLPALWMHRVMRYREVGRVRVRQVLGLTWHYSYTARNEP